MKITEIEIFAIQLPLIKPFVVSYASYSSMPSVIVKITTDNGLVGYGEGVPDEHVTGESWESVYHVLASTVAPKILGENPFNIERIHEVMDKAIKGVPTVKAAIDIACYDVMGKALAVPVYNLIGGRYHLKFPLTNVLSIDTPEKMKQEVDKRIKEGYRSFKIKVGTNLLEDIARIKTIGEYVDDSISIRVDANQGWENSANTLKALAKLQNVSIDWLEQPVLADDIDSMADIKSKTSVPLMIDEGLLGMNEMRQIIAKKAADKVNIKLMKCGGIYPAIKLANIAEMAGFTCQIGSMVESSLASAAGFHVAFSKKVITSVELTGPLKFEKDIGNLLFNIPYIELNEQPGLGIDVDEDTLKELTAYYHKVKI